VLIVVVLIMGSENNTNRHRENCLLLRLVCGKPYTDERERWYVLWYDSVQPHLYMQQTLQRWRGGGSSIRVSMHSEVTPTCNFGWNAENAICLESP